MKNLLTLIGLLVAFGLAAEPEHPVDPQVKKQELMKQHAAKAQAQPAKAVSPAPQKWAYSKGELSVDSFYTLRFHDSFKTPAHGYGVSVGYAVTENIVASVRGVNYLEGPWGIEELSGRLAYRAPVKFLSPQLAPYAFVEGGCGLQSGVGFGGAGGGIEWRPNLLKHRIGAFIEADVREDTNWKSSIGGTIGLRFWL